MSDNNLINIDGLGDVFVKFLDMLEKACVWAVSPHGSRKEFENGLQAYTKAISEDEKLSPLEKGKDCSSKKRLKGIH